MATGGSGNRRPAGAVFMGRTRRAPENLVPEPAGLDQPDACQRLASLDPLAASENCLPRVHASCLAAAGSQRGRCGDLLSR